MTKTTPTSGKSKFTLSDGEAATPLWMKLRRHLESRLDEKRKKNDQPLSPEETSNLRGAIAELKLLLEAGLESRQN